MTAPFDPNRNTPLDKWNPLLKALNAQGGNSTFDPKGLQGILARGKAQYAGGAQAPPGAGRPRNPTPLVGPTGGMQMTPNMMKAVQERLRGYTTRAANKSRANRSGIRR